MTPLGNTFVETWDNLLKGKSGITTLKKALVEQNLSAVNLDRELKLAEQISCQVAAPVRNVPHDTRTARFVQFALQASAEALQQACLLDLLQENEPLRLKSGVSIGSGMSSVRQIIDASRLESIRKLSPHFVPSVLSNSASGRVSIEYNMQGPNVSASTACAAGCHAIGDAMRYIQSGMADVMIAGGTEAAIDPLGLAGFSRLRALSSNYNDSPQESSRPFDKKRDGFVMGEGATVLVLEELQHALSRNAPILAHLSGYGLSGDAHHITSPHPKGRGAFRAMSMALETANVKAEDVAYVNAHATSTPLGDEIEAAVVQDLFQHDISISSTKGATGHLLGAAGALEAAFTVQALVDQMLPATLNLTELDDPTTSLKHVRETQPHTFDIAMSNSFGFGGTNASLLFERWSN